MKPKMIKFEAKIDIIGVNPFVFVPDDILAELFEQVGKDRGKIPVRMKIDGHKFAQTLVKYGGDWRLYINTPMRKSANKDVGDIARFEITFDPKKRIIPPHPKFIKALNKNREANRAFSKLSSSLKFEIIRYLSHLKTEESVDKNVAKAIEFLLGRGRFVGRNKPKYSERLNKEN